MTWTTSDIPDQSGRTAVVTGGNGGLGLETVRALVGARAHVVMVARDQSKAADAVADVLRTHPQGSLEVVELDLASQASTRAAAERIAAAHPVVDVLVNNAGVMAIPRRRTEDGFEMQLGVNHLGHWTLTALLLPVVLAAPRGRVVTVTSTAHHMGRRIDPDDPHLEQGYEPWRAYGQSKLANFHFGIGLQRLFDDAGVPTRSLMAHPGLTNSDLQAHSAAESGGATQRFAEWMTERIGMSTADGALPQLRAATDPRAAGGTFWAPRWVNAGPPVQRPVLRPGIDHGIDVLWKVSERETGVTIDLGSMARRAR